MKRSEKAHRPRINKGRLDDASRIVKQRLFERLKEKGFGAWTSRHEILGILEEEYNVELKEAVHSGDITDIKRELIDVAVGCLFAIACIDSDALDW